MTIDIPAVLAAILPGYALGPWGAHGVAHWARVMENGLRLAETTGADPAVVSLFALFHDSRRENEGDDPLHGRRGADLAAELRGTVFDLPDQAFVLLDRACEFHTVGRSDPDLTVLTCWDADRLDLGRVGIVPDRRYLCTSAAKEQDTLVWAYERSIRDDDPAVLADWNLPPRGW